MAGVYLCAFSGLPIYMVYLPQTFPWKKKSEFYLIEYKDKFEWVSMLKRLDPNFIKKKTWAVTHNDSGMGI